MAERYKDMIEAFCRHAGIAVPPGFHRNAASRYAAIDQEASPPKLVARTWAKQENVAYYLRNLAAGRPMRILDFKDGLELHFDGKGFARGVALESPPQG